MFKLKKKR